MDWIGAKLAIAHLHRAFVKLEDFGGGKALRRGDLQVVHAEIPAKNRQAGAAQLCLKVERIGALQFDFVFYDTVEVEVEDEQGDDDQPDNGQCDSSKESHNYLRGVKSGVKNKHRVYYGACPAVTGNVCRLFRLAGREEDKPSTWGIG